MTFIQLSYNVQMHPFLIPSLCFTVTAEEQKGPLRHETQSCAQTRNHVISSLTSADLAQS